MTAVLLSCVSALLFGAMSVGLRMALQRSPFLEVATLTTVSIALLVALASVGVESAFHPLHVGASWPFLLAGILSPGGAQLFVTMAIRDVGASRSSVVLGTAPLVSVTIALIFLGEPVSAALLVGAALVVAGGVELARERRRPEHLLSIGLLYALVGTVLFAVRDNILRWLSIGSTVPPTVAAAASLLGAITLISVVVGPRLRARRLRDTVPYVPAGLCFGTSYVSLFEAFYRGRVTVVAPLVATESLWGVLLSVLLIRHAEVVGRRLALGAALVVAGGALIGAFR